MSWLLRAWVKGCEDRMQLTFRLVTSAEARKKEALGVCLSVTARSASWGFVFFGWIKPGVHGSLGIFRADLALQVPSNRELRIRQLEQLAPLEFALKLLFGQAGVMMMPGLSLNA